MAFPANDAFARMLRMRACGNAACARLQPAQDGQQKTGRLTRTLKVATVSCGDGRCVCCRSAPGAEQTGGARRRTGACAWPSYAGRGVCGPSGRVGSAPGGAHVFETPLGLRRRTYWLQQGEARRAAPVRAALGPRDGHAWGVAIRTKRLGGGPRWAFRCDRCRVERSGRTTLADGCAAWRRGSGWARTRPRSCWLCARCGRALASGRPSRQRCPIPQVRADDARDRLAEQTFRRVLTKLLSYWRWAPAPPDRWCGGVIGLRVGRDHFALWPGGPGPGSLRQWGADAGGGPRVEAPAV